MFLSTKKSLWWWKATLKPAILSCFFWQHLWCFFSRTSYKVMILAVLWYLRCWLNATPQRSQCEMRLGLPFSGFPRGCLGCAPFGCVERTWPIASMVYLPPFTKKLDPNVGETCQFHGSYGLEKPTCLHPFLRFRLQDCCDLRWLSAGGTGGGGFVTTWHGRYDGGFKKHLHFPTGVGVKRMDYMLIY